MGRLRDWFLVKPSAEAWEQDLHALLAEPDAAEPGNLAEEFAATSYGEPDPPGSAWPALLIEAAGALDGLGQRLERVEAARTDIAVAEGYTTEGVAALQAFMAARGLTDVAAAIPTFEREHPQPEMVTGGGSQHVLPPARSARDEAAPELALLFEGDDQAWLARSIPLALREARGR